jgi:rod shape-determining protein MreB
VPRVIPLNLHHPETFAADPALAQMLRDDVLMIYQLLGRFSNDLAVDLGTANTLVYVRGRGIVLNEPSIVSIHRSDNSVLAVGHEAKAMLGRTPGNIVAIRPLKDGVIADFDVAEKMLRYFISRVMDRNRLLRPRIVIGVPSSITQVEKRAVRDAAIYAGAREVYLIEEPVAAAIGAGLPIQEPGGNLIVDIGGGTTEVAVIALSGIVYCKSVRVAGDGMNEAIIHHIKKHYNLLVGERRAEEIKIGLGSAYPVGGGRRTMDVKGRDLIAGVPKTISITEEEIRAALQECVLRIVETVRACLEWTPPEIAADMVESGIVLTGGGALLTGIDHLLRRETSLPVTVAENPLSCVALGVGKLLDDIDLLKAVALPA